MLSQPGVFGTGLAIVNPFAFRDKCAKLTIRQSRQSVSHNVAHFCRKPVLALLGRTGIEKRNPGDTVGGVLYESSRARKSAVFEKGKTVGTTGAYFPSH